MVSLSRILVVGAALALSGCMSARPAAPLAADAPLPEPPPGTGPHMLLGVNWQVVEFGGNPVIPDSNVTLSFADGRVSGSGGCNRITGSYESGAAAGGPLALKFNQIASTMMACPEDRMAQERAFLALVETVNSFTFDAGGDLLLVAPDGRWIKARRG